MNEPMTVEREKRGADSVQRTGSASEDAIVYSGKHYGSKHRILLDTGRLVTVIHEPSGYVVTVPCCDVERLTPNEKGQP